MVEVRRLQAQAMAGDGMAKGILVQPMLPGRRVPRSRCRQFPDPQQRQLQSSAFVGGFIGPGATERGLVYFPTPYVLES